MRDHKHGLGSISLWSNIRRSPCPSTPTSSGKSNWRRKQDDVPTRPEPFAGWQRSRSREVPDADKRRGQGCLVDLPHRVLVLSVTWSHSSVAAVTLHALAGLSPCSGCPCGILACSRCPGSIWIPVSSEHLLLEMGGVSVCGTRLGCWLRQLLQILDIWLSRSALSGRTTYDSPYTHWSKRVAVPHNR